MADISQYEGSVLIALHKGQYETLSENTSSNRWTEVNYLVQHFCGTCQTSLVWSSVTEYLPHSTSSAPWSFTSCTHWSLEANSAHLAVSVCCVICRVVFFAETCSCQTNFRKKMVLIACMRKFDENLALYLAQFSSPSSFLGPETVSCIYSLLYPHMSIAQKHTLTTSWLFYHCALCLVFIRHIDFFLILWLFLFDFLFFSI